MQSLATSLPFLHQEMTGSFLVIFGVLIFGLSTLVYLFLNFYSMRNYRIFRAYNYIIVIYAFWMICYILELITVDPVIKKIWFDLHFIGQAMLPFYWFSMILIFYDFQDFVMPIRYYGDIFTVITVLLFTINNKTGLIYSNFSIRNNGLINYISVDYGTWYYLIFGTYMFVFFTMLVIIFQGVFKKHSGNKNLVYIFVFSIVAISVGSVLNLSQFHIIPNVNHVLLFSPPHHHTHHHFLQT